MTSFDSVRSKIRSPRTQRTLDSIKDPHLRTERSIDQLIIDIDDKVLNFSKHGINQSKAPKKGQSLYSHEVQTDVVKREAAKLEQNLIRMS